MDFRTEQARERYDGLVDLATELVVALDFDGTLSPIVDDPAAAAIHPDAPAMLGHLAARVRAVVVITGRPARQVVALGDRESGADSLPEGASLAVMGQYGHERWDSRTRAFSSPEPPHGLAEFRAELPELLDAERAEDAHVEEKGLAVAVHTRNLADASDAFDRLQVTLAQAARRHGLQLEPGRQVLEVRSPGTDKGIALREAVEANDAGAVLFVGDDLGDIEGFQAVAELRAAGLPGLLVCSGSEEQAALIELSDVVVDGPVGVVAFLEGLVHDVGHPH
jgi:trehalose 6-phosphate phosphatase